MEPIFQLLSLLMLPISCQAKPDYPAVLPGGAWVWGRVGDQPEATTEAAAAAARAATATEEAATRAAPATEEEAASVEEFETIFPVSADSAALEPLLAKQSAVIELTPAPRPEVVTLKDGRWSWGVVATERSKKSAEV